jgi:phage shock protein PspC (stress-responsive transcriptional regulator)
MQKKLRKSADRKLFGVCGGIGEYLELTQRSSDWGLLWPFLD